MVDCKSGTPKSARFQRSRLAISPLLEIFARLRTISQYDLVIGRKVHTKPICRGTVVADAREVVGSNVTVRTEARRVHLARVLRKQVIETSDLCAVDQSAGLSPSGHNIPRSLAVPEAPTH